MTAAVSYNTETPFVGAATLTVAGSAPFDQPVYSDAIDVEPGDVMTVSVAVSSDTAVVVGAKLIMWYGDTIEDSVPGGYTFAAATLEVADLEVGAITLTGTPTVPAGMEYARVVVEIDTCTSGVHDVSVQIADVAIN